MVYETIDGETVIVNLKNGSYYSLVDVGTVIWTELEAGRTVDEILTRLNTDYDGDSQEIETALHQLLEELAQEQLLAFDTSEDIAANSESAPATPRAPAATKRKFQAPRLQKFTDMQDVLLLDPIHDVDETGWPHTAGRGRA